MSGGGGGGGGGIVRERHALVVCDLQPDLLGSLPEAERERLLDHVRIVLAAARRANWLVVFTGLRFGPGYAGVSQRHKLYGGLARLNAKVGDEGDLTAAAQALRGKVVAARKKLG